MKKFVSVLTLLTFLLLTTNCASIMKGSTTTVDIKSNPDKAQIYVDGDYRGATPIKVRMESKKDHNVEIKKDGYESSIFYITHGIGGVWIILDILMGLVPVIIDAATGAWYELDTWQIRANLKEQAQPREESKPAKPIEIEKKAKAFEYQIRIVKNGAALKIKPNSESTTIQELPIGAIFEIEDQIGDWVRIKLPPDNNGIVVTGYVNSSFVEFEKK